MKQKIALVIPYFGQWPEWMELFMYSCGKNSSVDFLFFTDCPVPATVYPNTIFHSTSFSDYKQRVSKTLGIAFNPQKAYKLCDLKPFYGVVHEKELAPYDFWGYCDIDMVLGDLTMLFNEKNLSKYDILTTCTKLIAGPQTIIRKKSKYTRTCLKLKNWKTRLEEQKHYGMDEQDFTKKIFPYPRWFNCILYKTRLHGHFFTWNSETRAFELWYKCFAWLNRRLLMMESYGTPGPGNGTWTYDLESGKITPPGTYKHLPKHAGKLYFHFFGLKKPHEGFAGWQKGFYKVPAGITQGKKGKICFDENGIWSES